MPSVSILILVSELALALFLSFIYLTFWYIERQDRTPLWFSAWLIACAVFAICRILQYAPLDEQWYVVIPRLLLTAAYLLAWLGYEFSNTFVGFSPARGERWMVVLPVMFLILLIWTTDLILTDQVVLRTFPFSQPFHGVEAGILYLPASLLILGLGVIPVVRLLRSRGPVQHDARLMAIGFLFVILFSLNDFITVALNLTWFRLSDFSYLLVVIFFGYIQAQRFGHLYRNMDLIVHERTAKLSQANEALRLEGLERDHADIRYKSLFEQSHDAIFILDLQGRHLDANQRAADLLGYSIDEILQLLFTDLSGQVAESKQVMQRLLAGEKISPYERMFRKKDGTLFPAEVNVELVTDAGGKPLHILSMVRDITGRKLVEEALRKSEELFSKAFRLNPTAIVIANIANGKIIDANESFERLFEYTREELIGHAVVELNILGDASDLQTVIQWLEEAREVRGYETTLRARSGNLRHVLVSLEQIELERETCILTIIHDITDRKQAEETLRQQAIEMTALYETTHDLVIETNLSKLLNTIVERAVNLLKASGGGLYLCEPEQRQVRCVVSYNTLRDYTGVVLQYGEGSAGFIAQTGEALNIPDYRTWEGRASIYEGDQPFSAVLSVPMRWQEQVIGVIHVMQNVRPRAFSQNDLQILTLFANQAAIAVEKSRLFASEERRRQEAAAIAEVSRDISASLELGIVLERISRHAQDLLHAETSAVYLTDSDSSGLRAIAAQGPDAKEIKEDPLTIGEGILGDIARRKLGEIVNETSLDVRTILIKGTETVPHEHLMGVPLLSRERLTGLIAVWRTGEGEEFKTADLDFLVSLARHAEIAIENARLFEAEHNRRQEAETLRNAAQRITSTLNQSQAIEMILDQLSRVVPYESASVQLLREGYLEIIGGQGWPDPSAVLGLRLPVPGDNPNTMVVQERRPIIIRNAAEEFSAFLYPPHGHICSWLGAPLVIRDRVIGMFAVDHSRPDFFTEADAQMVNAFAGQAAIAIENARLFEETQKRLLEIEAIAHVSASLSRTLELEPLLEDVLQSAIHAIPNAARGSILLADEKEHLHVRAVWGYSDARVRTHVFPPDEGYSSVAYRERRGIVISDVRAEARIRYDGDIVEMRMDGSALAAPLVVQDRPIGVIAIDTPFAADAFNEGELHLLEAMATPAALAIENARLFEDTRRRLAELEIIQTIASALRIAQTPDDALPIVLDKLISLLDVSAASVDLLDLTNGEIVTVLARGSWAPITGMRTPGNVGVSSHVIATGQPYFTTDVVGDKLVARPDMVAGLNTVVTVPIVSQHQPIGTLWAARQSQEPFTHDEASLLAALGEMIGNTIQRMKLHEQTVRQAEEITLSYNLTLEGWAKALELRDKETEGHSRRVSELTMQIARNFGVSAAELADIHRGVLLHDIGKMGVPDQVLKKTGPLNAEEWDEMRKHPQYAYDLIAPIPYLRPALDIPYCHHEKWDGSGYPRGLVGEQIPLAARIFAIVDVFDALSNSRPYRSAWQKPDVLKYLREQSGKHFDPRVVEAFFEVLANEGLDERDYLRITGK